MARSPHARIVSIILASVLCVLVPTFTAPTLSHAQGGFSGSTGWQFGAQPRFFGVDSGGTSTIFEVGFKAGGGLNLGCAGIGLFNFIKATFNFQNIVSQLKTYMQTYLAKTLLTTLMSVPQIAAIFDTLNALGNARFELFKQSCNIGEIRAAAKQMYIDRCLKDGGTPATCNTDNYDSQADWLKKSVNSITGLFAGLQNTGKVISDAMCAGQANCPMAGLIPPMRMCFQIQEGKTCPIDTGTRRPPVSGSGMFDAQFNALNPALSAANSLWANIFQAQIPQADINQALDQAEAKCKANPKCGGGGGQSSIQPTNLLASRNFFNVTYAVSEDTNTDMLAKFKSYIGCRDTNYNGLNAEFANQLSSLGHAVSFSPDTSTNTADCAAALGDNASGLPADVKENICKFMDLSMKCVLRKDSQCTNPTIYSAMGQLEDGAREAFQQRCGTSVAITSTKQVLEFVKAELNGTIGSKLVSDEEPHVETKNADNSKNKENSKDLAKEPRQQLVKAAEQMVKYFEAELKTLQTIEGSSKRWQEMIKDIVPPAKFTDVNLGV